MMVGLGLTVGAVLHRSAEAQADTSRAKKDTTTIKVPARPTADSTLRDTLAKRDSLHPRPAVADSIQRPYTRAPMPIPIQIGQSLIYDRLALFASGAVTLQDLLDRVPGITGLRSGWIASPMVSAYLGDVRRVRVFSDNVEYDEIDPRTGHILDLSQVQLWPLEELRIDWGVTEVRVYMRTWRVDRTTPYTRTDVSTGDQQTNLYRGFFGKRFGGGEGVQLAAQQYGTTPAGRSSPSSDALGLMGRIGWANHGWSFDAYLMRNSRNRGEIIPQVIRGTTIVDSVPSLQAARTDAYLRAGVGDPEHGPWLQAMASALGYTISHGSTSTFGTTTTDTVRDTTLFRAQYVLSGGLTLGPLRFDATERYRVGNGQRLWTPSGRVEFYTGPFAAYAFAEGRGPDSLNRAEVVGSLTPLSFITFIGAAGTSTDRQFDSTSSTLLNTRSNFLRAEAAIRVFNLWLGGGLIRRDSVFLVPPQVFGKRYVAIEEPAVTGVMARATGSLYKAFGVDAMAIRWNDTTGFYRPRYQTLSQVYLRTNWLSRFPSGNFSILAAVTHEYRSRTLYPVSPTAGAFQIVPVPDSRVYNFHLEIKIVSAILSYQFRNIRGDPYELVPGYLMPRLNQFYGVRWEFWN